MEEQIIEPEVADQNEIRPDIKVRGDVIDVARSPVYDFQCEPTFENPVPLMGLGGQPVGWANIYSSDGKLFYAEAFLKYSSEERLLLESGVKFSLGIRGSGDLLYSEVDCLMPNEKIRVSSINVDGLQLVQGIEFDGLSPILVVNE